MHLTFFAIKQSKKIEQYLYGCGFRLTSFLLVNNQQYVDCGTYRVRHINGWKSITNISISR